MCDLLRVGIIGIKRNVNADIPIFASHRIRVFFLREDRKRAVSRAHVDKETIGLTDQERNGFDLVEE